MNNQRGEAESWHKNSSINGWNVSDCMLGIFLQSKTWWKINKESNCNSSCLLGRFLLGHPFSNDLDNIIYVRSSNRTNFLSFPNFSRSPLLTSWSASLTRGILLSKLVAAAWASSSENGYLARRVLSSSRANDTKYDENFTIWSWQSFIQWWAIGGDWSSGSFSLLIRECLTSNCQLSVYLSVCHGFLFYLVPDQLRLLVASISLSAGVQEPRAFCHSVFARFCTDPRLHVLKFLFSSQQLNVWEKPSFCSPVEGSFFSRSLNKSTLFITSGHWPRHLQSFAATCKKS